MSTKNIKEPILDHTKHAPEDACSSVCSYKKFTKGGYTEGGATSKAERIGFIQKVYGILLSMLGLTAVIVASSLKIDSLRGCEHGAGAPGDAVVYDDQCGIDGNEKGLIGKLWISCAIGAIVSLLTLYCASLGADEEKSLLGKPIHMVVPYNYALLLVFTLCTSVCVSKISLSASKGNPGVVFEAVTLTSAAVLGITIFAFTGFDKIDGAKEISFIGPALSAIGLIFGVTSFFVFAPADRLGCA
jgi:FtsH-binding integral membrane protein